VPYADPAKRREYERTYRAKNGDKVRKYQREYKSGKFGSDDAATREYWRTNKRKSELKSKYGLSQEQYDAMLVTQGGQCALCRADAPGGKGSWHVDHCHTTGRVRGLLCHHCNLGLGNFRDNPVVLAAAIEYLKEPQ
jgi:hypothetical protein